VKIFGELNQLAGKLGPEEIQQSRLESMQWWPISSAEFFSLPWAAITLATPLVID